MKKTAVIIVNWNGWKDTIECLSSFEWPQLPDTCFYVLDNASQDQSIPQLQSWLTQQKINFITCPPESLDTIVNQALNAPQPNAPQPQSAPQQLASQQSTSQPQSASQQSTAQHPNPPQPNAPQSQSQSHAIPPQPQIFLVANPSNAGFAGGNNIILRHLLRSGIFHQAWLLNNDTTVLPDSLPELSTFLNAEPNRAFAGSVLLDYAKPTLVQCCGVRYYRYLGVSKLYMKNRPWQEIAHQDAQPPHPTDYYQIGASLMVKLEMLEQIGLMDERFFMYSEEADWQIRAKKKGTRQRFGLEICHISQRHCKHRWQKAFVLLSLQPVGHHHDPKEFRSHRRMDGNPGTHRHHHAACQMQAQTNLFRF